MRVCDLTLELAPPGTRIRVTHVVVDPPERLALGVPDDSGRLLGLTGTVRHHNGGIGDHAQLWVTWDDKSRGGTLSPTGDDEIEILSS